MFAYDNFFDDPQPISFDDLELYGVPEMTIEELRLEFERQLLGVRLFPKRLPRTRQTNS